MKVAEATPYCWWKGLAFRPRSGRLLLGMSALKRRQWSTKTHHHYVYFLPSPIYGQRLLLETFLYFSPVPLASLDVRSVQPRPWLS